MSALPEPPSRKECNDCANDDCGNENVSASTLVRGHCRFSLPHSSAAFRFTAGVSARPALAVVGALERLPRTRVAAITPFLGTQGSQRR
jgi:hypothetical protein